MTEFLAAIFAYPCVLLTALPSSGGLSPGEGWMPLHDAVGVNGKEAQLLKIKAKALSIWAKGCMVEIVFP